MFAAIFEDFPYLRYLVSSPVALSNANWEFCAAGSGQISFRAIIRISKQSGPSWSNIFPGAD